MAPMIRKDAGLYCGSRLRKGEVFAYVGSIQNLKDLKESINAFSAVLSTEGRVVGLCWELEEPKGPKEKKRKRVSGACLSVRRGAHLSLIWYHTIDHTSVWYRERRCGFKYHKAKLLFLLTPAWT